MRWYRVGKLSPANLVMGKEEVSRVAMAKKKRKNHQLAGSRRQSWEKSEK